jgi:acyl-coenzyme A thioesterase PaaI-like protein
MRLRVVRKQPNSRMCFVCGLENSFGLHSRFFELEDGQLAALFRAQAEHQGYPGRLHGGIAATILDETIGRAVMFRSNHAIWGVTVDFSMQLRRPVPIDDEIKVLGRITAEDKRFFHGEGEILLKDGQVAVSGRGRYLKMAIEKIADFDHQGEDWLVRPRADDPEWLDFGECSAGQGS